MSGWLVREGPVRWAVVAVRVKDAVMMIMMVVVMVIMVATMIMIMLMMMAIIAMMTTMMIMMVMGKVGGVHEDDGDGEVFWNLCFESCF